MLSLLAGYYNDYNPATISVFCIGHSDEKGYRNVGLLFRSFVLEIEMKGLLRNVVLLSRSFVLEITENGYSETSD